MIAAEYNKHSFRYSMSDNKPPPISCVLIGQHLTDNETPPVSWVLIDRPIFQSMTSPPCCNLTGKCMPNIRRGKKLGFQLSHKHAV